MKEKQMKIDLYTKIVLTIISICSVYFLCVTTFNLQPAQAQTDYLNFMSIESELQTIETAINTLYLQLDLIETKLDRLDTVSMQGLDIMIEQKSITSGIERIESKLDTLDSINFQLGTIMQQLD
jgi:hypothetical protein